MGRGRNCILAPRILRRMVREATKSPRITVKELQAFVASWGHQVSKSKVCQMHLPYDWNKVLWSEETNM